MSTGGEPTTYSEELSDSLSSFLIGLFLLCLTTMAMWMVEHQAVTFAMILSRAQTACRTIKDVATFNKNYAGRCVMVKGESKVTGNFSKTNEDADTGFHADSAKKGNVVRRKRVVEMYQWVEHEHRKSQKGKHDTVTYTYKQEWSSTYNESSSFMHQEEHFNPPQYPNLDSATVNATDNTFVGAYSLTDRQINMMYNFSEVDLDCLPSTTTFVKNSHCTDPSKQKDENGKSYLVYCPKAGDKGRGSGDIRHPTIGMVRICYACVYEGGSITTVGVLKGKSFRAFTEKDAHETMGGHTKWLCCSGAPHATAKTRGDKKRSGLQQELTYSSTIDDDEAGSDDDDERPASGGGCAACCICCQVLSFLKPLLEKVVAVIVGQDVMLLEEKHFSIVRMFANANDAFSYRLRMTRLVCVFLFWASISMIFSPISTILNWIPLIGGLVSSLFGIVTFVLAMVLALLVVSISWTVFHPEFLGIVLLSAGALCVFSTTATAGVVSAGYVLGVMSLAPFALMVLNFLEDRSFLKEQERLDDEMSHGGQEHESANLIANAV